MECYGMKKVLDVIVEIEIQNLSNQVKWELPCQNKEGERF